MAFCKFCGKQLAEGEICSCPQAQAAAGITQTPVQNEVPVEAPAPEAPVQTAPQVQPLAGDAANQAQGGITIQVPNISKDDVKGAWKGVLGIFKAPYTGAAEFVAGDNKMVSVVFILIQAILSSVFACICIGKINDLIGMGGKWLEDYKFSGVKAFFFTLLMSVVFSALYIGIAFCVAKIFRIGANIFNAIQMAAVRSVALTPVIILSWIIMALNAEYGIIVFAFGALFSVFITFNYMAKLSGFAGDKNVYVMLVLNVLFGIIVAFLMAKTCVVYLPSELKELSSGGIDSLLGSSLGSLF